MNHSGAPQSFYTQGKGHDPPLNHTNREDAMKKRTDTSKVMPILAAAIGDELARAVIELRDDIIRIPITEMAAKLLVKEYLKTGNPYGAAEMQIRRTWRGFEAAWFINELKKQERSAPRRSNDMADFAADIMDRYDDRTLASGHH